MNCEQRQMCATPLMCIFNVNSLVNGATCKVRFLISSFDNYVRENGTEEKSDGCDYD